MALDAAMITAICGGIVGIGTITTAFILQSRKQRNEHQLALEQIRSDRYLVDYEEVEDLRWWRRLAIKAFNAFLDDYAAKDEEPPVDVIAVLEYPPPNRPRSVPPKRRRLDEPE